VADELLPERGTLGEALTRLASVPWSQAEEPDLSWVYGLHVSSQAPALLAVLLGDAESEDSAQGGVALSPRAVGALVLGVSAQIQINSSGGVLWPVSPLAVARAGCGGLVSARSELGGRDA